MEALELAPRSVPEWDFSDRLFEQARELGRVEERNRLAREVHDTVAQDRPGSRSNCRWRAVICRPVRAPNGTSSSPQSGAPRIG